LNWKNPGTVQSFASVAEGNPRSAWTLTAITVPTPDPGTDETWDEPAQVDGVYQIGTASELEWFAEYVNSVTGVDDPEMMGILGQQLFCFIQRSRIQGQPAVVDPVHRGVQAVILHAVAQQGVHRGIEEVGDPDDQVKLGHRQSGFPFVYGSDCDPQDCGQGFLGHFPLFPERTYIFSQRQFHGSSPLWFSYLQYKEKSSVSEDTDNTERIFYFILTVWNQHFCAAEVLSEISDCVRCEINPLREFVKC
jgi:hypothetical protein